MKIVEGIPELANMISQFQQVAGSGALVGGGLGGAASIAGLAGALLSGIGQAVGSKELSLAGTALGATATVATTAAGATAAATTGAVAGASGAALVMAPIMLAYLAMSISDLFTGPKDIAQLGARVQKHMQEIPQHIKEITESPALIAKLNASDPEGAAKIFNDLNGISQRFEADGSANVMRSGGSSIKGHTFFGSENPGWEYEQGPADYAKLEPYFQQMSYASLRAQDIATQGGFGSALTNPMSAKDALSGNIAQSYFRDPESGSPVPGALRGGDYFNENIGAPSSALQLSRGEQAQRDALAAQANGGSEVGTAVDSNVGNFVPSMEYVYSDQFNKDAASLQPGNFEKGIRDILGREGEQSQNPFFNAGPSAGQVGSLESAESAGKRTPTNVMTGASGTPKPEVDTQRDMAAGSRGAPAQQPGAPGGFGGAVQGGFSVGQDNAFGSDDLEKKGKMGGTI